MRNDGSVDKATHERLPSENLPAWQFWGQAGGEQGPSPKLRRRQGHESQAAEEVPPRVTVSQHLAQDRRRSWLGVGLGRREVTGTFHPYLGRSPSAGVRSEQPTASWSSVKRPTVGQILHCAYPPHPRSPSTPLTSSPPAGQGCQRARIPEGWGWVLPRVALSGGEPLGQPSRSTPYT